jgi:hypothetical protein
MKVLLGEFVEKFETEDFFKPTVENKSLHQDSNYKRFRIVNFATSKNLVVKSTLFLHSYLHNHT